jgi:hypothetical protein
MTETTDFSKAASIIAKRMAARMKELDGEIQAQDDQYTAQLEKMRHERFIREELDDMTPEELTAYNREYSPLAQVSRLSQAAIQEADARWWDQVKATQDKEYEAWKKANPTAAGSSSDNYQFFKKQADRANAAYQARLKARERRALESEQHKTDLARLWSGLDADEQKILRRMVDEDGDELDRIRRWKKSNRNPIANVDDTATLYRMATQREHYQEFVPPTSDVENVESASTLYKMAARDMRENQGRK